MSAASSSDPAIDLPPSLLFERRGPVGLLRLSRPQKRNAIDDATIQGIEHFFSAMPDDIKAVVLHGEGEHFCAGLDLSELARERHRGRHRAFAGVASRLRAHRVRPRAGGGGAARRGGGRRARARRGLPYPGRGALGLLRAAGGQPRHFRRRRRLGAAAAAHRRLAGDRHDADRPHLRGRGGRRARIFPLCGRCRRRTRQGAGTCRTHRRQCRR